MLGGGTLLLLASITKPATAFLTSHDDIIPSTNSNYLPSILKMAEKNTNIDNDNNNMNNEVGYSSLSMLVMNTQIPVAAWYPIVKDDEESNINTKKEEHTKQETCYSHRISIKRIGELLAQWNFIPEFASKSYELQSNIPIKIVDNNELPSANGPVVLFAHGYLGSRFDLAHICEALAQDGFTCLSAEYPESLAASYERKEGLDRTVITNQLVEELTTWGMTNPTSFGIVGHSLGTGTALSAGDDSWARVCIAGFPRNFNNGLAPTVKSALYISSMNDGAVSPQRFGGVDAIPKEYTLLSEEAIPYNNKILPSKSMLLIDRPDGPNHISFLTDGVNNAMIDLLSPLLPIAKGLSIPVLDFDKYQLSRDSDATAQIVIPLVRQYLKEQMI